MQTVTRPPMRIGGRSYSGQTIDGLDAPERPGAQQGRASGLQTGTASGWVERKWRSAMNSSRA